MRNVILVHGGFGDGSGWAGVHERLVGAGYRVTVAQNANRSLAEDVSAVRRLIALRDGPVTLVGHSYGGVVIAEAGRDPKVSALVHVAAFAPDRGESVDSLIADPPPGASVPPPQPTRDGCVLLDRDLCHAAFAGDLPAARARFMADSQVPWGSGALTGAVGEPAWRTRPSWYLVAADDRMIPPPAQRPMAARAGATVVEAPGSHAIHVSRPEVVVDVIERATGAG